MRSTAGNADHELKEEDDGRIVRRLYPRAGVDPSAMQRVSAGLPLPRTLVEELIEGFHDSRERVFWEMSGAIHGVSREAWTKCCFHNLQDSSIQLFQAARCNAINSAEGIVNIVFSHLSAQAVSACSRSVR